MMFGEFVRFSTDDGMELQGFLRSPATATGKAMIHLHGLAGNFYQNAFIDAIGDAAVGLGWNFLAFNSRGHNYIADILNRAPNGTSWRQLGAAFERFEDCVLDVRAAIDFVESRGSPNVVLQGHSSGAAKIVHYVDRVGDVRTKGLVLLSPADDLGLQHEALGERFGAVLQNAQSMIASGQADELMPRDAFEYVMSAGTYVDMFGTDSKYSIFEFSNSDRQEFRELEAIELPVLAVIGTDQEAVVGDVYDFMTSFRRFTPHARSVNTEVIVGASHRYTGFEASLAVVVSTWLDSTFQ